MAQIMFFLRKTLELLITASNCFKIRVAEEFGSGGARLYPSHRAGGGRNPGFWLRSFETVGLKFEKKKKKKKKHPE